MAAPQTTHGKAPTVAGVVVVEAAGRRWELQGDVASLVAWCCVHEPELTAHPLWRLVFDRAAGDGIVPDLHKRFPRIRR